MTTRLATVANATSINVFAMVAGQDVSGDTSGWNHSFTNDTPAFPGSLGLGNLSETCHAPYDLESRRVIFGTGPHTQNIAIFATWFTCYQIDDNKAIDNTVSKRDGTDIRVHAYEMFTLDTARGIFYNKKDNEAKIWQIPVRDKAFSALTASDWTSTLTNLYSGVQSDRGTLLYWPERNSLIYILSPQTGDIWEWNLNQNTTSWTRVFDGAAQATVDCEALQGFYSMVDHCVIFGGGGTTSSQRKRFWKMTNGGTIGGSNLSLVNGLTITRLDDCGVAVYFDQLSLGWFDPITGNFFIAVHADLSDSATWTSTTYDIRVWKLNHNASLGSQWTEYTALEGTHTSGNWPVMGQTDTILGNLTVSEIWDQGVVLFFGDRNIYLLKTTANNRAGHETGDGVLTLADKKACTAYRMTEAFDDQSRLKYIPNDPADTNLIAAFRAVPGADQTVYGISPSRLPGEGTTMCFHDAYLGPNTGFGIPQIVTDSGQKWLQITLISQCGEDTGYYINNLDGTYHNPGSNFYISPISPYGRVIWVQFQWKMSVNFWDRTALPLPWRMAAMNLQSPGPAQITAGSNVFFCPTAHLGSSHPLVNGGFTTFSCVGRQLAVQTVEPCICTITSVTDDNTVVVDHIFQTNSSSVAWSLASNGLLGSDGREICNSGMKITNHEGTPPFQRDLPQGSAVLADEKNSTFIVNQYLDSPNWTFQKGHVNPNDNEYNFSQVPFIKDGTPMEITYRIEQTPNTATTLGSAFPTARITTWINGVSASPYLDWGGPLSVSTAPILDWGSNDGAGNPYGLTTIQLLLQRTYHDVLMTHPTVYGFYANLITSSTPIPMGGVGTVVTPPTTTQAWFPFLYRSS